MTEVKQAVQPEVPEVPEVPVMQLNDKFYNPESVTDAGKKIVEDIYKVDGAIAQHQTNLSIAQIARGTLLEALEKEAVNFEEVEAPDGNTDVEPSA